MCISLIFQHSSLTYLYGESKIKAIFAKFVAKNHGHNTLGLFDTLPNLIFTTNETKRDH